jgi:ABC-type lipoprotein release transport system permease subunit
VGDNSIIKFGQKKKVSFSTSLRVAFFLAYRDIKRANVWTTILTIAVMVLTFLNLVVVSGVLVGLIEGAVEAVKTKYISDVFISTLKNHPYIENSPGISNYLHSLPEVKDVSIRFVESGTVQGNYKDTKKAKELKETVGTSFAGIDPFDEDAVSGLSKSIIEGEYLSPNDYDNVLVGSMMFRKYINIDSSNFPVLEENVGLGSKIKVTVHGNEREVIIKGIVKTKVDEIDRRVFFTSNQLRSLLNRFDYSANEIVAKLKPGADPNAVRDSVINAGFGKYAKIQTAEDAEPKFIKDMKTTFAILGAMISSIGLVVASITVFIVIFINAITRRKFIGILKGIGIYNSPIEISYVFQSVFYAVCGMFIGSVIVFVFLKPYITAHPINFPFSDGILVATASGTIFRGAILLVATIIAGYIPARIVVKQNTLDAILGR